MIVVLKLKQFQFEAIDGVTLIRLDATPMIGYLPVYANRQDAERDYPNGPFVEGEMVMEAEERI